MSQPPEPEPAITIRTLPIGDSGAPRLVAAGEMFDLIEVDIRLARAVLAVLDNHRVPIGAVIHDRRYGKAGFLVPPADEQPGLAGPDARRGPRQYGRGCWVTMPTGDPGAALVWLRPPTETADGRPRHLTETRLVRAAIHRAATTLTEEDPRP